ncbi:hypothetical protein BH09VER1_BH09VER1_14500 [soil metagenome]
MILPWFHPLIRVSDLPRSLTTATAGVLNLHVSHLVRKSDGLHVVPEDGLRPGNEVRATLKWYSLNQRSEGEIEVRLSPPKRGRVDPEQWVRIFDQRHPFLRDQWKDLVSSQPQKILRLIRKCGEDPSRWPEIKPLLCLQGLGINIDADDQLSFSPLEHFPSFDLFISINARNRITDAHFDG